MRTVEIEVSEQAREFYLQFTSGWEKAVGHEIRVDDFRFSAIPARDGLLMVVSEVECGAKMFDLPVPDDVGSFEEAMEFLSYVIGPKIAMLLEEVGYGTFRKKRDEMKADSEKKFGPQPEAQDIDTDWLRADVGDLLH